jgi:hypothetical protein
MPKMVTFETLSITKLDVQVYKTSILPKKIPFLEEISAMIRQNRSQTIFGFGIALIYFKKMEFSSVKLTLVSIRSDSSKIFLPYLNEYYARDDFYHRYF